MAQPARMQHLTAALRATASRAAATTGGYALLFASAPGGAAPGVSARLRAAAGFGSPDEARKASEALLPGVREAISNRQVKQLGEVPALGERAAGGASVMPLVFEDNVHGALVVAGPVACDEAMQLALAQLASSAAVHLDHLVVAEEIERLRSSTNQIQTLAEEKSDELLKLSEELFAQDIELLRTNEKLGKIEKLKNDFIEKMSRELRTPLNSIIESIISVLAGENDALSDGAKASLAHGPRRGNRLPAHAPEHPRPVAHQAGRAARGDAGGELPRGGRRDDLQRPGRCSTPRRCRSRSASTSRCRRWGRTWPRSNQILFLLLDNAAKFTEEGKITITARVREGHACTARSPTRASGSARTTSRSIFDEFFQVDELSSPPLPRRRTGAHPGPRPARAAGGRGAAHQRARPRHHRLVQHPRPARLGRFAPADQGVGVPPSDVAGRAASSMWASMSSG